MFIFPRTDGLMPHYMPTNLYQIIQNVVQIFDIDRQKPSDLKPAYIVNVVRALMERLLAVLGDNLLSREAQANTSLTFQILVCTTFAMCRVLEEFRHSNGAW